MRAFAAWIGQERHTSHLEQSRGPRVLRRLLLVAVRRATAAVPDDLEDLIELLVGEATQLGRKGMIRCLRTRDFPLDHQKMRFRTLTFPASLRISETS